MRTSGDEQGRQWCLQVGIIHRQPRPIADPLICRGLLSCHVATNVTPIEFMPTVALSDMRAVAYQVQCANNITSEGRIRSGQDSMVDVIFDQIINVVR